MLLSEVGRGRVILVVVLLAFLGFGGARVAVWWRAQESFALEPGEPNTPAELDAWYPAVPDNENAALVYLRAFGVSSPPAAAERLLPFYGDFPLPKGGGPLSDSVTNAITAYLTRNAEKVRLLHEGAVLSKSRYPVNYRSDDNPEYMRELRYAVYDLALEAILAAEQQRGEAAVQALLAAFALMASLETQPAPIVPMVRQAFSIRLMESLDRVICRTALPEAGLISLSKAISRADTEDDMRRGLVGMRCLCARSFEHPSTKFAETMDEANQPMEARPKPNPRLQSLFWEFYRWSGGADLDHRRFNALLREWQDVRTKSFPERLQAAKALQDKLDAMTGWATQITRRLIANRAILRSVTMEAAQHARLSVTQTALAVERYRCANGKLPDQLQDLTPQYLPERIADPFTGKDLAFQRKEQGYSVSSVGWNTADLGGKYLKDPRQMDIQFDVTR